MFNFYIDTADIKYIEEKWDLIKDYIDSSYFLGITTNPNAFMKENLTTWKEWETQTRKLTELVTKIKKNGRGLVHVQLPNDNMSVTELFEWAKTIHLWSDNITEVALKIPPYKRFLDNAHRINDEIGLEVNVTGLSDCATALFSASRPGIRYISMIPGRMEEVGIAAKNHIAYVLNSHLDDCEMITGSMRTLEGLKWCVEFGTVPTIGKRVLDLLTPENCKEVFSWANEHKHYSYERKLAPLDEKSTALSEQFFTQMNEQGLKVATEFKEFVKGLK